MKLFVSSILIVFTAVTIYYMQTLLEPKILPIVEGFFQPEFMAVANTLRRNMESGVERGAALAVYHDGEVIVDMWAGYADPNSLTRWRNETTTLTFDCSQAVTAIVIARMVEKGLLNYSKPISQYWPQFGVNGKEEITLEELLSHQAGIPYLSEPISLRDVQTGSRSVERSWLGQVPAWEPGSKFGYHTSTYGLYLDRLVQSVDPTHRDIATIFNEDIAVKYGVEFSFNVQKKDFYKTARLQSVSMTTRLVQLLTSPTYLKLYLTSFFDSQSVYSKALNSIKELAMPLNVLNNPELREITLSSYSGTGTARGLAMLFSRLVAGPNSKAERFLSADTLKLLTEELSGDTCNTTGLPRTYGRGVQLFTNPYGERIFGHAGEGGQMVIADPTNKLTMAYLTNYLSIYKNGDDPRFLDVQKHLYTNLERYIHRKKVSGG